MPRAHLGNLPSEVLAHGSGPDEEQVLVVRQARGNGVQEPCQVLEPVRLAGRLRRAATTVSNARVMPDVARRPVMCRDL